MPMSEGGKPKGNVSKPACGAVVAALPAAAWVPAAAVPAASAELLPSAVADTHTADTSPVSLPRVAMKPPETEPASAFPALAADASPIKPHAVGSATLRGVLLGKLWRRRGSKGPYWEWALAGFCGTLLLVTLSFRWLERSVRTDVEEAQAEGAVQAHTSRSARHGARPAPEPGVAPSPGPNAPPPPGAESLGRGVPVPSEKASPAQPVAAEAPAIRTAKRALRPRPSAKRAPLPSPPPAAAPSTAPPPPPAAQSAPAARPSKAQKSDARGSVRAGLAQELP